MTDHKPLATTKATNGNDLTSAFDALMLGHQSGLLIDQEPTIKDLKQQAVAHFVAQGLPTIKHEEWKYTSTKAFAALGAEAFVPTLNRAVPQAQPTANYAAPTIVLVDGLPVLNNADQYRNLDLGKGIRLTAFSQMDAAQIELVAKHLGTLAPAETDPFVALNTASFQDGLLIEASKNAVSDAVLHLVHQYTGAGKVAYTRILLVVEQHAELKLAHHIVGNPGRENAAFGVLVVEAVVAQDAILKVDIVQEAVNTHIVTGWYATQGDKSVTTHSTIYLDGPWVRNNLNLAIPGQYAEGNMYGLYLGSDRNLIDNHTLVDHIAPNSNSNELYKGVAKDRSTAIFNGKIFVKQAAQKTNAFQSNRNLILSDDATVNTKPQLEIFADDVKCSHGATTGALDEEPIFYLRARGLDEDQARSLLLQAFADEVNAYLVSDSLRTIASAAVERFLH